MGAGTTTWTVGSRALNSTSSSGAPANFALTLRRYDREGMAPEFPTTKPPSRSRRPRHRRDGLTRAMCIAASFFAGWSALAATGCAAAPPRGDTPAFLDESDLAPAVLISSTVPGIGSGVVLAPDVVLTCAHVIEHFSADVELSIDGRRVEHSILAAGDARAPNGDWVLLRVDRALRGPDEVARIRADTDASPPPGTEVFLVGYPGRSYPGARIDLSRPPRVVRARMATPDDADQWRVEGVGWDVAGLSGGGAYSWNAAEERLELFAICVAKSDDDRRLEGPLGLAIPLGRTEHLVLLRLPEEVRALATAPR